MKSQDAPGPAYFLSDLHLGAYPETERVSVPMLMDFLAHVADTHGRLFIVGDLLDFWFEYGKVVPSNPFALLARLKSMVDGGCRIDYVAGNHDYWMGDFLARQVGVRVQKESLDTSIDGRRFFISHGDGIATTGGVGYRVLKAFLHSRLVSAVFRTIHPDIGLRLAAAFSRLSRQRSSKNNSTPNLEAFVRSKADAGFDYVVLGHLHKPKLFEVSGTRCLVVGDWIDNFTYGVCTNGVVSLARWPASGSPQARQRPEQS